MGNHYPTHQSLRPIHHLTDFFARHRQNQQTE